MASIVLLTIGMGMIWTGIKFRDEVGQITGFVCGVICLIWGFALTTPTIQIPLEIFLACLCSLSAIRLRR